jgi:hypothetical protein
MPVGVSKTFPFFFPFGLSVYLINMRPITKAYLLVEVAQKALNLS